VDFGISGLPTDATATFSPASTGVTGNSATVQVATADTTPPGSYHLSVTGTGSGVPTGTTNLTMVVQGKQPFTISGGSASALSPGESQPLNLSLTNPYNFDLSITGLQATPNGTSSVDCDATTNFSVTQIPSGQLPVTLPAGQTKTLDELGITDANKPQVSMLNLNSSQNACKGANLHFSYTGSATK
jgi:hypothetical protein